MIWILWILAAGIALQYGVVPIVVRFAIKIPVHPEILRVQPDDLDREIATYFMQARADLAALGFESVACFTAHDLAPGQRWFLQAFINRETNECASANYVRQPAKNIELRQHAISFLSTFQDGRICGTTNTDDPSPFPRDGARVRDAAAPGVHHVPTLYATHRASAAQFASGARPVAGNADRPETLLRRSLEEQMRDRVLSGHLYIDDFAGAYRPTWIGAFLMSWRLMWPIKQIRRAFARRWALRLAAKAPAATPPRAVSTVEDATSH